MNYQKISVIVPSFNQGRYLEETLVSITSQNYPDLELFVVDGASSDNSVEIIKKYEKKINWWVSEKDNGQSEAINKGLQRATGEIITWLCSDDLYTPGTFKKIAEYFSKQPEKVGLIHGGTTLFNASGETGYDWGYKNPSLERSLAGIAFSQPSAFFLKKYIDIIGRYVNESLHYGMDYDLYVRLACVCRFVAVKDIFSAYRLHDNSKSIKEQYKFIDDWSRVFVNLCKNIGWNDLLDDMKASGFFSEGVLDFYSPFSFSPERDFLRKVDKKKILFYHYCYVLKDLYWTGQMDKAGILLKRIKENYPDEWIRDEKEIPVIIKKLALPRFILKTMKRIKRL